MDVLAQSKMPKDQLSSLTPHSRGVRYFIPVYCIKSISGALDSVKHGQKTRTRIVVRPSRHYPHFHSFVFVSIYRSLAGNTCRTPLVVDRSAEPLRVSRHRRAHSHRALDSADLTRPLRRRYADCRQILAASLPRILPILASGSAKSKPISGMNSFYSVCRFR